MAVPSIYPFERASYAVSADGWWSVVTGVWNSTSTTLSLLSGATWAGLHFDLFASIREPEQGYLQAPPIIDSLLTDPSLIPALTAPTLSLQQVNAAALTFNVRFSPEVDPEPYSAASNPGSRGELFVGSQLFLPGPGVGVRQSITLDQTVMAPYTTHRNWRGRMAMMVAVVPFLSSTDLYSLEATSGWATLEVDQHSFHTGGMDFPHHRRGRVVHDYKMGYPYMSDESVADGYLEGVKVHPDSWDPKDPTPTYVPPTGEGVADDDVTDLE